jgi:hypothetical protein
LRRYEYAAASGCSITGILMASYGYAMGRAHMRYMKTKKVRLE